MCVGECVREGRRREGGRRRAFAQLLSTAVTSVVLQLSCARLPWKPYEIELTIEFESSSVDVYETRSEQKSSLRDAMGGMW